ncbi:chemotaxis protein CheD [Bdellovibrio bacteriovorus]|uniref:Chemotaxis protein CheD n=1 Tax=Bdellovibrio bacteriovorus TaxID=959 RepID=A0A1Z3N6B6_BDEBC|nr:chemotaxis protein CheD [Bdellovibrio bacteriovorus]ASD62989.1 chemotaxis protein CheD [Bdellovibrio bacteriovorus]
MLPVEHHVRIGQILIAENGEVLKTVLGSCVGIALVWRRQNKWALAHCLLPYPETFKEDKDARYVSQTIPRMLERMGATLADVSEMEAIVAGGGRMMDGDKSYTKFVVGDENLKAAKAVLEKHRIRIVAFEPGGEQGTKMRIAGDGDYSIERLPKTG